MEIELNLSNKRLVYGILAGLGIVLVLVGLAFLGKPYTPVADDGGVRLLTWQDWQIFKIERQYEDEIAVLRSDAEELAALLNRSQNPVAAQLLATRIGKHTTDGLDALEPARSALALAAQDVLAWSSGSLDRDTASASLFSAVELLK